MVPPWPTAARLMLCLILAVTDSAISIGQRPLRPEPFQTPYRAMPSRDTMARTGPATPKRRPRPLPIAIEGYCPVTLRDHQRWQLGDRRVSAGFDGQQYRFATELERARFLSAPMRYAPALGGDCIVSFEELGERVSGRIEFGVLHGGRTYFFAAARERDRFQEDPDRFASADLANEGYCLVRAADRRERTPGTKATELVLNGLRYRFAGTQELQRFTHLPADYLDEEAIAPSWVLHPDAMHQPTARRLPNRNPYATSKKSRTRSGGTKSLATNSRPQIAAEAKSGLALRPEAQTKSSDHAPGFEDSSDQEPMLNGFCPVTIVEQAQWLRGRDDLTAIFDGRQYLFASESRQEKFLEDPYPYIPALGGRCVVAFVEEGADVPGSIEHPKFHLSEDRRRLYLLSSEAYAARMGAEPTRFVDADLFHGGDCIVTLVDDGLHQTGAPDIGAWHHDRRYLFLGEEQRDRFRASPEPYVQAAHQLIEAPHTDSEAETPPVSTPLDTPN